MLQAYKRRMPSPSRLPPQVVETLARGGTILTSNQRAARTLRHAFDAQQHAAGKSVWEPPPIFAWDTWLKLLWDRLMLEGQVTSLLLNRSQEHTLWREIIRTDAEAAAAHTLRPIDSLAQLAARAWALLHEHRARRSLAQFADTADTRAFARWAAEFDRRSSRADFLSAARLEEALTDALVSGDLKLRPSTGLLLVGFDSKTPAQTALLSALVQSGVAADEHDATASELPRGTLLSAASPHDELAACARWIRTHLTANERSRVGVIVPGLAAERAVVERTFRHILAPELDDIAARAEVGPYELSLGVPLAATSAVNAALDILSWMTGPLPFDRASALLLSPHFAAGTERLARAELDAYFLRQQQLLQPELSVGSIADVARKSRLPENVPQLLRHLGALAKYLDMDASVQQTHADWAATFAQILQAAGWSDSSSIGSTDFQLRKRWNSTLDELASLDFDGSRVTFGEALASLRRIAADTLFAPESRDAPVQVMGPLEAAGSSFDVVWFLRAGDLSWPTTASPNPLLPWRLQRDLSMPGADSAVDADLARRITQRIAASAPTAIFSYAAENSAGVQRPSSVLSDLPLTPESAGQFAPPESIVAPVGIDVLPDATPVPPPPDRALRGGSSILAAQAACGFRAFAEKRLASALPDAPALGLDAAERGNLVHSVLQGFWGEIETQEALRLLSPIEREGLLIDQIDASLQAATRSAVPGWSRAYLATERQRLLDLLRTWLDHELARKPFQVRAREHDVRDVEIGPLHMDLRIDRIDTHLVEGQPSGEILLDYKTGTVSPSQWLGERPDDPQVPLYAIVGQANPLAAVAFANVKPGRSMGVSGYQRVDGILPKASRLKLDSLETQVAEWRAVLTSLATQFYEGNASVEPKQYPATCRYCQQRMLCRLNPASLDAELLEDLAEPQTKEAEGEFA